MIYGKENVIKFFPCVLRTLTSIFVLPIEADSNSHEKIETEYAYGGSSMGIKTIV